MIDDVTKSIKAQLYDRISSPLFSSFLISWAAWNYKFIIVVLSGTQAKEKFLLIDLIFPDVLSVFLRGGMFPLFTALAIIFIYPYPARFIYRFSRLRHQELKVIQTEIDDSTPMTKEEAKKLRRDALTKSEELESQLEKNRLEATHLKERIVELQREIEAISKGTASSVVSSEPPQRPDIEQDPYDRVNVGNNGEKSNLENSDFKLPQISEEAQELLLEATDDKSGTILHAKYIGGTSIQTNGRNQIPSEDRETVATWESALRELVEKELAESVGNKGEVFQITALGYKVAKRLPRPIPNINEREFAREITGHLKNAIRWDVLTNQSSPIFLSLLQEYLDKHVPQNIAIKLRHQNAIAERLHAAFLEIQAREIDGIAEPPVGT